MRKIIAINNLCSFILVDFPCVALVFLSLVANKSNTLGLPLYLSVSAPPFVWMSWNFLQKYLGYFRLFQYIWFLCLKHTPALLQFWDVVRSKLMKFLKLMKSGRFWAHKKSNGHEFQFTMNSPNRTNIPLEYIQLISYTNALL